MLNNVLREQLILVVLCRRYVFAKSCGLEYFMPIALTYLSAVEPKAAKTLQHLCLKESDPTSVKLHYHCKWRIGCQDDVVNHTCVIADPDMVWPGNWSGAMISYNSRPACHERLTLELHKHTLPAGSLDLILLAKFMSPNQVPEQVFAHLQSV